MGDIVHNKKRRMFREARKENPQAPNRKRGRPTKENALDKRQQTSTPSGLESESDLEWKWMASFSEDGSILVTV